MFHPSEFVVDSTASVVPANSNPGASTDDAPPGRTSQLVAAVARVPASLLVLTLFVLWLLAFGQTVAQGVVPQQAPSTADIALGAVLHLPYLLLMLFLTFGFIERAGYFFHGRAASPGGTLPDDLPKVCIQLPMFNEDAVACRIIDAAAAIDWPLHRLEIQVLDDSTDAATQAMVRDHCDTLCRRTGLAITMLHRTNRSGYKAGALEAGRHQSDADFIAIFDADFLPPVDYLRRAIPHFYGPDAAPIKDLGLVQAQWGHLNDDESPLTAAQALWVDDHHTLQQSWRSAVLGFVNFTGTAGVWRAQALQDAGGWRSASLVEDCEISFRALFAGYRTKFVKELVVPAELPQSIAAYRSQQKRWTQGWAQLQRLHLGRLLFDFRTPLRRKAVLTYMMCISWQWPLWLLWIILFPFLMAKGLSFAAFGTAAGLLAYLVPPLAFALVSGIVANRESRATYMDGDGQLRSSVARRCGRIIPYLVINAAMLPHHVCAFLEGLFGPLHTEFERTPKTAQVSGGQAAAKAQAQSAKPKRKLTRPGYALAEGGFVAAQIGWISAFTVAGPMLAAAGAAWLTLCIAAYRLAPFAAARMAALRLRSGE
jgi:cellulose synthase/poly-beta-1,6-N-acetylglucosamine synthase-like glycosyltransferase